jgi:hypothetical protein
MSRSYKKAIFKDKPIYKKTYWRTIRRVQRMALKQDKDIPDPKTIINNYDYCDYTIDVEHSKNDSFFYKNIKKFRRK